jgi:hypothetical protein
VLPMRKLKKQHKINLIAISKNGIGIMSLLLLHLSGWHTDIPSFGIWLTRCTQQKWTVRLFFGLRSANRMPSPYYHNFTTRVECLVPGSHLSVSANVPEINLQKLSCLFVCLHWSKLFRFNIFWYGHT